MKGDVAIILTFQTVMAGFRLRKVALVSLIIRTQLDSLSLLCEATSLKQQKSKFHLLIQCTDASYHIDIIQWPVVNEKLTSVLRICQVNVNISCVKVVSFTTKKN